MPSTVGGSEKLPSENVGSVRTTAVDSSGRSPIAARTCSGGLTCTFQSAPTCVCAASAWLRNTIAR